MGNAVTSLWPSQVEVFPVKQEGFSERHATTGASLINNAGDVAIHGGNFTTVGRDLTTLNVTVLAISPTSFTNSPVSDATRKVRDALSQGPFLNFHQDTAERRTTGTGLWLLEEEEFKTWANTPGAIFWVTGMPGAGKTYLASCVVDDIREQAKRTKGISIAFAYFRHSEPMTVLAVLESLVAQQAEWSVEAAEMVVASLECIQAEGRRATQADYVTLLKSMSRLFTFSSYLLDGLDEAPPDAQFNLLEVLSSTEANICIFSRPLEGMQSELKNTLPNVAFLDIAAHDRDIELLIEEKISSTPEFRRLLAQDPTMKSNIVKEVPSKAEGMFLHASLQIEALRYAISLANIIQKLEQFPKGIDGMYETTLERIDAQAEDRPELAKRILIWLLYIEKTLTLDALQQALATSIDVLDERAYVPEGHILSVCCGLVTIDPLKQVHLVHSSANNVLKRLLTPWCPSPYSMIAQTCMAALFHQEIPYSPQITDKFSLRRVICSKPFLNHAYFDLCGYLRQGILEPESSLLAITLLFLRKCKTFPALIHENDIFVPATFDIWTPLHVAAWFGVGDLVKILVEEDKLDVNVRSLGVHSLTPLMLACMEGREGVVRYLLSVPGIHVNLADEAGRTALTYAAKMGHDPVLARLLENEGIDANARDKEGVTAVMHAAEVGREGAVERLLAFESTDVGAQDWRGKTALMFAASKNRIAVVERLLLHPGANLQASDISGKTALMWAAWRGHWEVLRALLANPSIASAVNAGDKYGMTALMHASRAGWLESMKLLLATPDIDVNALDRSASTALMYASEKCHPAAVQLLLGAVGIDADARDKLGRTALMRAASAKGGEQVVLTFLTIKPGVAASGLTDYQKSSLLLKALEATPPLDDLVIKLLELNSLDVNTKNRAGQMPLILAAEAGHLHHVERLLRYQGTDVNARDIQDKTPLMCAASRGHVDVVMALLSSPNVDANAQDCEKLSALAVAVTMNHPATVDALLRHPGINLNCSDARGRTPLMRSAALGYPIVTRLLLATDGVDVNRKDKKGRTALMHASERGHVEVVEQLVAMEGINVDETDDARMTALIYALAKGHASLAQILMDRSRGEDPTQRFDINAPYKEGKTLLMYASSHNLVDTVEAMLKTEGINVNAIDGGGWTALQWAVTQGHVDAVRALLAHNNTNPTIQDNKGRTALIRALGMKNTEVARMILAHGVDIHSRTVEGKTALIYAAEMGLEEAFEDLCDTIGRTTTQNLTSDTLLVNVKDNKGRSALAYAAMRGSARMVQRLLSIPGVDVDEGDAEKRRTPLLLAAARGNTEVVQILLGLDGVDVNATDSDGWTPLIWAANEGRTATVEALLAKPGIKSNVVAQDGNTALFRALSVKRADIAHILLNAKEIDVHLTNKKGETPLILAADRGLVDVVQRILSFQGVAVNASTPDGRTALILGARRGDEGTVEAILSCDGVDIHARDKNGRTALWYAERARNTTIVRRLRSFQPRT